MTSQMVRTRFAPSPTGYMHIGNLRTALYAYLIAKRAGGSFVLRIEDTDQERLVEGAVPFIYHTLQETGLKYDEGPDVGGDFGPYIQSERMDLYKKYAEELQGKGEAYPCFCDKDRLNELKEKGEMYDRKCRNLSKDIVQKYRDDGRSFVIRQKMPDENTPITFHDEVYGDITIESKLFDDQILMKSDGFPTYNFANVVDDHVMNITHVVRGSEYLSSTPKYNLLYEAFGWDLPTYVHLPTVMKEKGKKLSKRDGAANYNDFKSLGYLPEAIINYIALLGWGSGDDRELYTIKELSDVFDYKRINKSPSIFDEAKFQSINAHYIKELSDDRFFELASPILKNTLQGEYDLKLLSTLLKPRISKLSDLPEHVDFFKELPDYSLDMYVHKKMKTKKEETAPVLESLIPVVDSISEWTLDGIHAVIFKYIKDEGLKTGKILWPLRVALSGKDATPGGATELLYLLGKDEGKNRLSLGISKLKSAGF